MATELAQGEAIPEKADMDQLKQLFYRFHNQSMQEARKAYLDAGGVPEEYVPEMDPSEDEFRQAMQTLKERRAAEAVRIQEERAANLEKKQKVLDEIQKLTSTPEEATANFDRYKQLQQEWKEIGPVPAEQSTEMWKKYQLFTEQFYDLVKMGHELRDYDFKKNLEIKTALCEQAEALADVEDEIAAFNTLQGLHQEWKETGPVERDLREPLWNRFKEASTVVNKRHQTHFEALKVKEEENLEKKTSLCEKVEALVQSVADDASNKWDELTREVLEIQAEWKTIGFAPQKQNGAIFERFREACDQFFTKKAEFYKAIKDIQAENLQKKQALIEKAKALKESTEWKKTSAEFVELQKQWKEIGPVARKVSESVWKEFTGACDAFFEARKQANAGAHNEQKQNMEQKNSITAELKALLDAGEAISIDAIKELQAKWNAVGYVPFKEKEKVYAAYREVCDALYDKARSNRTAARVAGRFQKIQESAGDDMNRMSRIYEQLKNEIRTYENNLGFLSASSKKGSALVDQMQKKVDALKAELKQMEQKMREQK